MADGRILHRRGSFGDRIVKLDHLPFRVWCQYVLSADDYGVMRASASVIRADNPRLEQEPLRAIVRAMVTIEQSGLVSTFTHQGVTYWWQTDWQDFQGVRYPRESVNPKPAPEVIATATPKTQRLFALRSVAPPQDFGNDSEIDPHPAGAGGRQTLTPTQTPTPRSGSSEKSARETNDELEPLSEIPPKWGHPRRRHSLDASVDYHRRNCPPWAAAACEGGICIPKYLWQQWDKRQPPNTLEAFVVAVMHKSPPAGDDGERFWPAHFQRAFGTTAPSSSTKPRTAAEKTLDTLRRA